MLTDAEKASTKLLGEAAATKVSLDVLEDLYHACRNNLKPTSPYMETAMKNAWEVLYWAGRVDAK